MQAQEAIATLSVHGSGDEPSWSGSRRQCLPRRDPLPRVSEIDVLHDGQSRVAAAIVDSPHLVVRNCPQVITMMSFTDTPSAELFDQLQDIVQNRGLQNLDTPVRLASGAMSRHFIDGKLALAEAADLRLAGEVFVRSADESGVEWDAVGGLTMGADAIVVAIALASDRPTNS